MPIGEAVVTSGGRLKARHIIHVITPVWNSGANREDEMLAQCVVNAYLAISALFTNSF